MRYIFVDLDHTLFHSAWRDALAPNSSLDTLGSREDQWAAYSVAGSRDKPVVEMVAILKAMWASGFKMVVLTAINEKYKDLVEQRLADAFLPVNWFYSVLMRPLDDRTPSAILKPAMASAFVKTIHGEKAELRVHAAFVIEDRPDVIESFKALGVSCLQAHVVPR